MSEYNVICYCPFCKTELINHKNMINYKEFIVYECSKCGKLSKWDFKSESKPIIIEKEF